MKFPIYGIILFCCLVGSAISLSSACKPEEYACRDSDLCIEKAKLCDNEANCPEKDDEDHEWCGMIILHHIIANFHFHLFTIFLIRCQKVSQ